MPAVCSGYRRDGIAGLRQRLERPDVGDRPGNALDVGKGSAKDLLCEVNSQGFNRVKIIASLVVAFSRQTFCVSSVKIAGNDVPHGRGNDVF